MLIVVARAFVKSITCFALLLALAVLCGYHVDTSLGTLIVAKHISYGDWDGIIYWMPYDHFQFDPTDGYQDETIAVFVMFLALEGYYYRRRRRREKANVADDVQAPGSWPPAPRT
jgi:hypothetical protein